MFSKEISLPKTIALTTEGVEGKFDRLNLSSLVIDANGVSIALNPSAVFSLLNLSGSSDPHLMRGGSTLIPADQFSAEEKAVFAEFVDIVKAKVVAAI